MNIPLDTDLIVMAIWGLIFAIFVIKLFPIYSPSAHRRLIIVERLGKYHSTLDAGLYLIPLWTKSLSFMI